MVWYTGRTEGTLVALRSQEDLPVYRDIQRVRFRRQLRSFEFSDGGSLDLILIVLHVVGISLSGCTDKAVSPLCCVVAQRFGISYGSIR